MRKGTLIGSYRDATEPDITLQGRVGDGSDTDVQLGNHGSPLKIRSHFYTRLNCICFSSSSKPDGMIICSHTENGQT